MIWFPIFSHALYASTHSLAHSAKSTYTFPSWHFLSLHTFLQIRASRQLPDPNSHHFLWPLKRTGTPEIGRAIN